MTRHLLRLIWNRKRQNFLLTVEIFCSFLTLFGVVLFAVHYANNARQPLGFEIDRMWSVTVDRKEADQDPAVKARHRETYRQLFVALREMPEVEGVAGSFTGPYANAEWGSGTRLPGGRQVNYGVNRVTDDFPRAFPHPDRGGTLVFARRRRRDVEAGGRQSAAGAGDLRRRQSGRADHQRGARSERSASRSERQA